MLKVLLGGIGLAVSIIATTSNLAISQTITIEAVNEAAWVRRDLSSTSPQMIKLQVLLDRAHASPGAIDGRLGTNTKRAIAAFREINRQGEQAEAGVDQELWEALSSRDKEPVLVRHVISDADVEGPFIEQVPSDFQEMAKLTHIGYTSVQEKLAEQTI
jgi:peptidoglycan hydrolase-like protein with peptidoglycan-binding domain